MTRPRFGLLCAVVSAAATGACAQLHHVQLGDIDARHEDGETTPIDIKMSETGVSTAEAGLIAREIARESSRQAADAVGRAFAVIELFQMGPRTGLPVWDVDYAEGMAEAVRSSCPDGEITALQSVRESRHYAVVSGEIVHVSGTCHHSKNRQEIRS